MYYVEKSFRIPMGHRLSLHLGNCKFNHGHNFLIKVEVSSGILNYNNMVMDFSDLKKIVQEILDQWDHAFFVNKDDVLLQTKIMNFCKIIEVDGDPTAEKICEILYNFIATNIKSNASYCKVESVSIWETEDSMAMYKPD